MSTCALSFNTGLQLHQGGCSGSFKGRKQKQKRKHPSRMHAVRSMPLPCGDWRSPPPFDRHPHGKCADVACSGVHKASGVSLPCMLHTTEFIHLCPKSKSIPQQPWNCGRPSPSHRRVVASVRQATVSLPLVVYPPRCWRSCIRIALVSCLNNTLDG
jgi:hypothetical protein